MKSDVSNISQTTKLKKHYEWKKKIFGVGKSKFWPARNYTCDTYIAETIFGTRDRRGPRGTEVWEKHIPRILDGAFVNFHFRLYAEP